MKKVLILCTGNSCRSQMADGWLKHFTLRDKVEVYSAGTHPEKVNPYAIKVMRKYGIDISKNKWIVFNPKIFSSNGKNELDLIYFKSNFDYERIQNLFSNLSSLSILELYKLKKNYNLLNLSTTEIRLQIQKILSFPFYLCFMSILAAIIMFNFKKQKSNTLKISFGLFLSVLIYYINNFLHVLGKTEKINIILSIWVPILILIMINFIYTLKINEK